MKKLRIGVLGAGAIARAAHIPGYAASENCELTAIADISPESLAGVREKWQFKKEYSDCSELIQTEKPDLVSICLPNIYHARYAIEAMEAGCDVILEKPVATTLEDALAIAEAQKRTGRKLAVCFSHRFNQMVIAAKNAVDAGAIGKPYMMRVRFAHGGPFPGWAVSDWFYDPERAGGGAVLDMGIHAMDLMLWFLGKATEVKGFAGTLRKDIAVDDNMTALLKFGNDAMGYMECGWTSCAGFSGQEIMGDNGAITIDYAKGEVVLCSGVNSPDGSLKMETQVIAKSGKLTAWQNQMAVFIEEKIAGKDFSTSIQDGIEALKVGLGVYESSEKGNTVKL